MLKFPLIRDTVKNLQDNKMKIKTLENKPLICLSKFQTTLKFT